MLNEQSGLDECGQSRPYRVCLAWAIWRVLKPRERQMEVLSPGSRRFMMSSKRGF